MGTRDQIRFWGAMQHFHTKDVQEKLLGIREILEICLESMWAQTPWGSQYSIGSSISKLGQGYA